MKSITREMMLKARDYIPLAEKEAWVQQCADRCFDRLAITVGEDQMPPMFSINTELKSRYLMAALVGLYFGARFESESGNENLMTASEYDAWAIKHPLNQIERWKHDAELKNKCFDLLADYKDLEKRLSAHIGSLLTVQNDFVMRQNQYMDAQMKQMPELVEQLQMLQGKRESDGD